jgi:hypothetical protein
MLIGGGNAFIIIKHTNNAEKNTSSLLNSPIKNWCLNFIFSAIHSILLMLVKNVPLLITYVKSVLLQR